MPATRTGSSEEVTVLFAPFSLPGRRVGKEWRFARAVLLEWMASGPDRHDLELYNRRGETEPDEMDEPDEPEAGPLP
jgi:hypothetical protein